jgi:hypothetical protein
MTTETKNLSKAAQEEEEPAAKIKDIETLHQTKEHAYKEAIALAFQAHDDDNGCKRAIQSAALALEEIFRLHGQEWMLDQIGSIIVRDLKTRGFPESKYLYVYKALREYEDRFIQEVDHSSSKTLTPVSKQQELFYRANAQKYYDALAVLKELRNEHGLLTRKDIQTIVPELLDYHDTNEKLCIIEGIPLSENKQNSFEGGPEKFSDPIRINKPVPRVPEIMTEELNIWINTFLPALLKKLTDYPITDHALEKRMAEGWAALRHAHDPATDDKYRKSFYEWITIVQFADESFKHHAASRFKTQDFRGQWRKLTREQIGARQKTIPIWCKWFFEKIPGFMEWIAWSRTDKEPYLSGFSIDLSPKLSDRSIK